MNLLNSKTVARFKAFIEARGAEVLVCTNEYELCRFRASKGVSVIYRKESGRITHTNESETAFKAFVGGIPWRGNQPAKRSGRSSVNIRTIRRRDGDGCFFCAQPVSAADESIEHLVAITAGGPSHISNMFLSHAACNAKAGHMSAPEKIRLHVEAIIQKEKIIHEQD